MKIHDGVKRQPAAFSVCVLCVCVFSHNLTMHLTFHALALLFLGATDKEGVAV